jgi:hypothetical protein
MVVPARPHGPCAQPGLLGQRHGLPATNRSRWPSTTGPNPGCLPAPAGPGNTRWSAAPTGPRPTGHTAKPSAWSSSSATVTGSLAQRRQRRRRITPNTNTTTTTTISTHNHVDMEASLVGAGQFTVTLLPPTRANNSVTARRPPGPGSTAGLRASSRDPAPRDLPPIWAGRPVPAQPGSRPRAGPGGAEQHLPCLGGGTIQAWLCRCAMADAAPPAPDPAAHQVASAKR